MSTTESSTRAAILEAADRLFATGGYHGVGMERIAAAAGVSRQAVYLHFGSKAGLLVALGDYQHERTGFADLFERTVWSAPDAVSALDAWVEAVAVFVPQILGLASAIDAARRSDADADALHRAQSESRLEGSRRLARWLERDGVLAPPWTVRSSADVLWALGAWRTYEELVVERAWSRRRFVDHLQTLLRRTLVRAATGRDGEGSAGPPSG